MTQVRIVPEQAYITTALGVVAGGVDPRGQRVEFAYQWVRNGEDVSGATGQTLPGGSFERGDLIRVRVTPMARSLRGPSVLSAPVTILNSSPVIRTVRVIPEGPRRADILRAVVDALDADKDRLLYSYQWMRNGEAIPDATAETLSAQDLQRGDRISVRVRASDLEARSREVESPPVPILNTPPHVLPSGTWQAGPDGTLLYRLLAIDPDGDPLTYSLSPEAPRGMSIDARTGVLSWRPVIGDPGPHRFSVTISDGEAMLRQEVIVALEERKAPPGPALTDRP